MTKFTVYLIRVYQFFVSPVLVAVSGVHGCKFRPTCSEITVSGVREHGVIGGLRLGLSQLVRCY